jgi:hypothetical protein
MARCHCRSRHATAGAVSPLPDLLAAILPDVHGKRDELMDNNINDVSQRLRVTRRSCRLGLAAAPVCSNLGLSSEIKTRLSRCMKKCL